MKTKTKYVLGFLFDPEERYVVLIKKNSPEWQKGKLNGVGGKIKNGEDPDDAMFREFKEETGVEIDPDKWIPFCLMKGEDWSVYTYFCHSEKYNNVVTMENEPVSLYRVEKGIYSNGVLHNLKWLIPLALDSKVEKPIVFNYKS